MEKRFRFKSCLTVLILLVAVIVLGCWLRYVFPDYLAGVCPSTLMYTVTDGNLSVYTTAVYNEKTGVRYGPSFTFGDDLVLLGYDKEQDAWVCCNKEACDKPADDLLVLFQGKKKTLIPLKGLPESAHLKNATMLDEHVYVPSAEDGNFVVYCYATTGTLKSRRVLSVPGAYVDDVFGEQIHGEHLAVASNGSVVAPLSLAGTEDIASYLFDGQGRIIRKITEGDEVFISHDGSMLAYRNHREVVLLDLKTGHRKTIKIWPLTNIRPWDMLINPSDIRWDFKRQWLFCAYTPVMAAPYQVYGADISSDRVHWKRLPMIVETNNWILLDELPKSCQTSD